MSSSSSTKQRSCSKKSPKSSSSKSKSSALESRVKRIAQASACYDPENFDTDMKNIVEVYSETAKSRRDEKSGDWTDMDIIKAYKGGFKAKPVSFYACIWSQANKSGTDIPNLKEAYHASSFIKYQDGNNHFFIHLSHQLKGANILVKYDHFLNGFQASDKQIYYKYAEDEHGISESNGAIVCSGDVKPGLTISGIAEIVLRWWYFNDYLSGGSKSRFPASCTGLTETVISYVALNPLACPDIKLHTGFSQIVEMSS